MKQCLVAMALCLTASSAGAMGPVPCPSAEMDVVVPCLTCQGGTQSIIHDKCPAWQAFWPGFKAAVSLGDKDKVTALTVFPFPGPMGGVSRDQAAFAKDYNRIFTDDTRAAIKQNKYSYKCPPAESGPCQPDTVEIWSDANVLVFKKQSDGAFRLAYLSLQP